MVAVSVCAWGWKEAGQGIDRECACGFEEGRRNLNSQLHGCLVLKVGTKEWR
jgi:hypothetical protein